MACNESVGVMHPAYFVGRVDLLEWLNGTLDLKLARVEDTANGAVACQVFDLLFPNLVQMSKVNWGAQAEWEYVQNYKVLQLACDKIRCTKRIEVDRLIKGKQQDNLEFLQWLKKFFDDNYTAGAKEQYNAVQRRSLGKGKAKWMASVTPTSSTVSSASLSSKKPASVVSSAAMSSSSASTSATPGKKTASPVGAPTAPPPPPPPTPLQTARETNTAAMEIVELRMKIAGMKQEIQDMCLEHEGKMRQVEKELKRAEDESEYYFDKLSRIEALVAVKPQLDVDALVGKLDGILFDEEAKT